MPSVICYCAYPKIFSGSEDGLAPGAALIPLHSVADIKVIDGPAQISREFAKRRVVVGANVHERDLRWFCC